MEIGRENVEFHISDDIYEDGLSKDRLYDTIKRILAFYEFMNYVCSELGINRVKSDKDLV